jgi:hypothetical protein
MVNLATIEQQLLQDFESYNFVLLEKIDASELILHITRLALDFMFANILEMSYQNIPLEFYGNIFDLYRLQLEDISTSYLKERRLDSTPEMSNEYNVEGLNNDLYNCVVISMNIVKRYYITCRS